MNHLFAFGFVLTGLHSSLLSFWVRGYSATVMREKAPLSKAGVRPMF